MSERYRDVPSVIKAVRTEIRQWAIELAIIDESPEETKKIKAARKAMNNAKPINPGDKEN